MLIQRPVRVGNGHMSESLVLTVTNLVQVAQVAVPMETVAEGEGESVCDFSLEEVSDDQVLIDALPVDLPVIGQPPLRVIAWVADM